MNNIQYSNIINTKEEEPTVLEQKELIKSQKKEEITKTFHTRELKKKYLSTRRTGWDVR